MVRIWIYNADATLDFESLKKLQNHKTGNDFSFLWSVDV